MDGIPRGHRYPRSHETSSSALIKIFSLIFGAILLILSRHSTEEGLSWGISVMTVTLYFLSELFTENRLGGGGAGGGSDHIDDLMSEVKKNYPQALENLKNTDPRTILSSFDFKNTSEADIITFLTDAVRNNKSGTRTAVGNKKSGTRTATVRRSKTATRKYKSAPI